MKKIIVITQMIAVLAAVISANAQVDWRFGFEWNEMSWLGWSDPDIEKLLIKLENIGTAGGINVNGNASWIDMQPNAEAEINFKQDPIVTVFQNHGFSLTLYLKCDAPWAFPSKTIPYGGQAAPDSAYEQHWIDYVKAVVERYDGDGIDDMEGLVIPIQYYIFTGEIVFGGNGLGDADWGPYWFDTIDNLLYLHRITYRAVHEADPSGYSKVVSAGAVLWDLYADFPDYPEFDPVDPNSTIQQRLNGENYRSSIYTAGWDSLKKMLDSFGNDADGIECDYIGWHPHFSWRVIDQEFALIHNHAGNKPIYVDDMWCNLFDRGYFVPLPGIPGYAQFNAPANPYTGSDWISRINGDFPNPLFTSLDPYAELFQKLNNGDQAVLDWYSANGARRLVKSFASAFGEGAIIACFSMTNDLPHNPLIFHSRGWPGGWINLTGTRDENYFAKPQYYTYKLLVEKLNDFTTATEVSVSDDSRTRVYEFDRPRGPIYVLWSETGDAPPDLDYRNNPAGETMTFEAVNNVDSLKLTHIITDTVNIIPDVKMIPTQNGQLTIRLGYEPIFLEGDILAVVTDVKPHPKSTLPASFKLEQNYPNPFNPETVIEYQLPHASDVEISIFNLQGQRLMTLVRAYQAAGTYNIIWNGMDESGRAVASGVYLYQLKADDFIAMKKLMLLR